MDLFEILDENNPDAPKTSKAPPVDLVDELNMIIQKHGINLPIAALQELASLYSDPPPWAPWK